VCDVDDPLHMVWLIDVLFFDTTRLRGSTISNCVPLLMEFNEVLLHYPNSHFPTTGAAAFSTPIFVCTYIIYIFIYLYVCTTRTRREYIYTHTMHTHSTLYWPTMPPSGYVCGFVLLGHHHRRTSSAGAHQNLTDVCCVCSTINCCCT